VQQQVEALQQLLADREQQVRGLRQLLDNRVLQIGELEEQVRDLEASNAHDFGWRHDQAQHVDAAQRKQLEEMDSKLEMANAAVAHLVACLLPQVEHKTRHHTICTNGGNRGGGNMGGCGSTHSLAQRSSSSWNPSGSRCSGATSNLVATPVPSAALDGALSSGGAADGAAKGAIIRMPMM